MQIQTRPCAHGPTPVFSTIWSICLAGLAGQGLLPNTCISVHPCRHKLLAVLFTCVSCAGYFVASAELYNTGGHTCRALLAAQRGHGDYASAVRFAPWRMELHLAQGQWTQTVKQSNQTLRLRSSKESQLKVLLLDRNAQQVTGAPSGIRRLLLARAVWPCNRKTTRGYVKQVRCAQLHRESWHMPTDHELCVPVSCRHLRQCSHRGGGIRTTSAVTAWDDPGEMRFVHLLTSWYLAACSMY